jgi:hypothetical protein
MAVVTTYTCDRCFAEQTSKDQFWTVGVTAKAHSYNSGNAPYAITPMEVCRDCLENLGIYPQTKTTEQPTYNPPTLEDLIVELVQREMDNA